MMRPPLKVLANCKCLCMVVILATHVHLHDTLRDLSYPMMVVMHAKMFKEDLRWKFLSARRCDFFTLDDLLRDRPCVRTLYKVWQPVFVLCFGVIVALAVGFCIFGCWPNSFCIFSPFLVANCNDVCCARLEIKKLTRDIVMLYSVVHVCFTKAHEMMLGRHLIFEKKWTVKRHVDGPCLWGTCAKPWISVKFAKQICQEVTPLSAYHDLRGKSDGAHAQAVRFTDNVDKMKLNQADFKPEIRAASSRPTVQLRKSQNQLADNPIQSRQQVIRNQQAVPLHNLTDFLVDSSKQTISTDSPPLQNNIRPHASQPHKDNSIDVIAIIAWLESLCQFTLIRDQTRVLILPLGGFLPPPPGGRPCIAPLLVRLPPKKEGAESPLSALDHAQRFADTYLHR